jgi:hypothetical protein
MLLLPLMCLVKGFKPMIRMKIRFVGFLALMLSLVATSLPFKKASGQASIADSTIQLFLITANYSAELPGADFAERFGTSHFLGASVSTKTSHNWKFTTSFDFLFGGRVKEDPLTMISADNGNLINGQGTFEPLEYQQRGFRATVRAGKVLPVFGPNPNSGLLLQAGGGFFQHKIRYNTQSQGVFQLRDDYVKGYDRLTNGFALTQTIGYLNLSDNKLINFKVAFQVTEAFTKNRRSWNFDEMRKADEQRLDLLYGIKISWSWPVYDKASQGYYYQ